MTSIQSTVTTKKISELYLPPNFKKYHSCVHPTPGQIIKYFNYVNWLKNKQQKHAFFIGSCRYTEYNWDAYFPGRLHSTKEIIYFLQNMHCLNATINRYPEQLVNCIFGDLLHKTVACKTKTFFALNLHSTIETISKLVIEISSRKVYYHKNDQSTPYNYFYTKKYNQTANMTLCELTNEEIEHDIKTIHHLFTTIFPNGKYLLIIPHVNLKIRKTNKYIDKRNDLCQLLKEITAGYKTVLFCDIGDFLRETESPAKNNKHNLYLESFMKGNHWKKSGKSKVKKFLDKSVIW